MLVCCWGRPRSVLPHAMMVSTMSRYSRCLAAVIEVGEPSECLAGLLQVVGFVELVELLEGVPGGSQPGMSVEQPVDVSLVGFG